MEIPEHGSGSENSTTINQIWSSNAQQTTVNEHEIISDEYKITDETYAQYNVLSVFFNRVPCDHPSIAKG
jgi:hypothetical protein